MNSWAAIGALCCVGLIGMAGARADDNVAAPDSQALQGFINHIPVESTAEREARHQRIATLRQEPVLLLVHRGASRLAPENTLEAFNLALDGGAEGVEIDIRRSKDGVLYMFHDDTLDRMTDGSGRVRDLTYYELLEVTPPDRRPATLAAVLTLARQRDMLLHLDVKESGIEDEIVAMFDEADVWNHVVHINAYNSDSFRFRPDLELYAYKGWVDDFLGWLKSTDQDPDTPGIARGFLENEGKLAFTKYDPVPAARLLDKSPREPRPIPEVLRAMWTPDGPSGIAP